MSERIPRALAVGVVNNALLIAMLWKSHEQARELSREVAIAETQRHYVEKDHERLQEEIVSLKIPRATFAAIRSTPIQTVSEPVKTDVIELDAERIETLLVLTQDDETGSPLELMLQAKYGQGSTRHGAYDIALEYSKKLKTIARWTNDTPAWIKKELLTTFDAYKEATQMISEYYAKAMA